MASRSDLVSLVGRLCGLLEEHDDAGVGVGQKRRRERSESPPPKRQKKALDEHLPQKSGEFLGVTVKEAWDISFTPRGAKKDAADEIAKHVRMEEKRALKRAIRNGAALEKNCMLPPCEEISPDEAAESFQNAIVRDANASTHRLWELMIQRDEDGELYASPAQHALLKHRSREGDDAFSPTDMRKLLGRLRGSTSRQWKAIVGSTTPYVFVFVCGRRVCKLHGTLHGALHGPQRRSLLVRPCSSAEKIIEVPVGDLRHVTCALSL